MKLKAVRLKIRMKTIICNLEQKKTSLCDREDTPLFIKLDKFCASG